MLPLDNFLIVGVVGLRQAEVLLSAFRTVEIVLHSSKFFQNNTPFSFLLFVIDQSPLLYTDTGYIPAHTSLSAIYIYKLPSAVA